MQIDVLIPTFRRSFRLRSVAENVLNADARCVPVFVCESDDEQSIEAVCEIDDARLVINSRSHSYAGAINSAVLCSSADWLFLGADDLKFSPSWLDAALDLSDQFCVIGTNDLHNDEVLSGKHSTHSLVANYYAQNGCIDDSGVCLSERYKHNWCDTEFIETAKMRGVFSPCLDSVVEHLHWAWGLAQQDSTYEKARISEAADRELFQKRRLLWNGI